MLRLRGGGPRKRRAEIHFTQREKRRLVQQEIPHDLLGREVHPFLKAPARIGSTVRPAWKTEAAYDIWIPGRSGSSRTHIC